MKERVIHLNATVCYLKKDNQVLMLKFNKKWGPSICTTWGKI